MDMVDDKKNKKQFTVESNYSIVHEFIISIPQNKRLPLLFLEAIP